jgi:GT2 family glycosyltransferase
MGEPSDNRPKEISLSPLLRREVAVNTGAFLAIQKSVFDELGGLDDAFTVAGDVDFCLRAEMQGYKKKYIRSSRSVDPQRIQESRKRLVRNRSSQASIVDSRGDDQR